MRPLIPILALALTGTAHASEAAQAADTSQPVVIEVLPSTLGIYVSCPDAPTVEVTLQYPYIKAPSGSVCGVEAWGQRINIDVEEGAKYTCTTDDQILNCTRTDPPSPARKNMHLPSKVPSHLPPNTQIPGPQLETAVALNLLVGFGAGHFYADNNRRGVTHLIVDAVGSTGLGIFGTLAVVESMFSSAGPGGGSGSRPAGQSGMTNSDIAICFLAGTLISRIVSTATTADSVREAQRAMSADNVSARDVWWTAAEDIDAGLGTHMDKRSSDWSELVVVVRHHGRQGASASDLLAAARAGQSMNPECLAVGCLTLGRSLPHR